MADMEADDVLERSEECHKLLMDLKNTVERLLAVHASNVWSTYGGFKRVCCHIESVLCHRIKTTQTSFPSDGVFWPFVRGLKWLRPGMTSMMEKVSRSSNSINQGGKGQMWLRESLQDHSLASQLEILVGSPEHLHYHYQEGAFLRRTDYVEAMIICLRALESNKVAGLAEINPQLLQSQKLRRRSMHNSSRSVTDSNMSYDPYYRSWSTPDLASSPSLGDHQSSDHLGSDAAMIPGVLRFSSVSFPTISSANTFIPSTLSDSPGLSECVQNDPLLAVEYGTSPPLGLVKSSTFKDSVFCQEYDSQQDVIKSPVQRSISDGSEVSNTKMVSRSENKTFSIPIPETVVQQYSSGTWHGVKGQRQLSSENSSSPAKQHKRSQSDFGVGTSANNKISIAKNVSHSGDWTKSRTVKFHASDQDETVMQRNQRVNFQRGDNLLQPPAKGQSLMSYLSEQDFNYCALLERENAHFGIADVLISVFEQMKWETTLRKQSLVDTLSDEDESDDEINELKQRIRIRRRERLVEKAKRFPANSDGMNDTNTTSSMLTASSPLSSHSFSSLSDSSEHSDDAEDQIELTSLSSYGRVKSGISGTEASNLAKLKNSGLSLSMASLYSEAELKKSNQAADHRRIDKQNSEKSNFSAEAIAISLLRQFSEKRLPKASELDWLVSEKDAPQALLPLPNSYPISPDDGENADLMHTANKTKLRGNLEWAPPRAQIIFTIHPQEKRNVVLSRQNMRCAGCGTKAELAFVRRLRYCEYMGKYFCQCCHSNATEIIPGRVIMRWDFTRYYVSNFAHDLLGKIHQQPLFHVDAINPLLYKKVRLLDSIRDLRRQLKHLHTLLSICKRNTKWLEETSKLPKHWVDDDNLYSMEDFFSVRTGQMYGLLKYLVSDAVNHVDTCALCQGLGFICEICKDTRVIFPFQLNYVTLCPVCQACYHRSCYIPGKCPKCSRIEMRRRCQAQSSLTEIQQAGGWDGGGGRKLEAGTIPL